MYLFFPLNVTINEKEIREAKKVLDFQKYLAELK